jgi:hypothetical protein
MGGEAQGGRPEGASRGAGGSIPGASLTLRDIDAWPGVPAAPLDLGQVGFIDPFGLVLAACAGHVAARAGRRSYRLPADPSVATYCVRMGLVEVLAGVDLEPVEAHPPFEVFDRADVLAELAPVDGPADGTPPVAALVLERLAAHADLAEAAFCCVAEAANNVGEHARSTGYASAQVYHRGLADERVVLAIGDPGQGVARSLLARHGAMDDIDAVRRVVEQGVSGTRDLGTGIAAMLSIVDELGGRMILRSGRATVRRYQKRSAFTGSPEIPGTAVGIELPC